MSDTNAEHKEKVEYIAANPYDYKGFCEFCKEKGFAAIPYVAFASVAQEFLPDGERVSTTAVQYFEKTKCGGCGGGKVR